MNKAVRLTPAKQGSYDAPHVAHIDRRADFEALRGAWKALHARDPAAGVFMSFDWLRALFAENPGDWRVLALCDPADPARYVAFLPLRYHLHWSPSQQCFQTRIAAAGRLCFSEYVGFVCDPEQEAWAIPALGRHLAGLPWSRFSLRYEPTVRRLNLLAAEFDANSAYDVAWPSYEINQGKTNQLVSPQIALPPDFETYLAGLSRNTRQKVRKLWRQHLDTGDLVVRAHPRNDPAITREAILTLWSERWSAVYSSRRLRTVAAKYRAMMIRAQALGMLYLPTLWHGDRLLGGLAIVTDTPRGRWHFMMTGRDLDAANTDIGLLLHSRAIYDAIEQGVRVYDFGHGDEPYKYRFGAQDAATGYLAITRRAHGTGPTLDPMHLSPALARTATMLSAGRVSDTQAALTHLGTVACSAVTQASGSVISSSP